MQYLNYLLLEGDLTNLLLFGGSDCDSEGGSAGGSDIGSDSGSALRTYNKVPVLS